MTPDERALALARLDRALSTRALYRRVYQGDEAVVTLAQMMDDAGYYSTNPETIKPELIAAVNRLLQSIGTVHPLNTFNFAKALVSIADDEDLVAQKVALEAKED